MRILTIIALGCLCFMACKQQSNPGTSNTNTPLTTSDTTAALDKIVYVDIDTLLSKSELYKVKKTELENQSKVAEKALAGKIQAFQTRLQQFQKEVADIQQKAPSIAPVELKKMEEQYAQKQMTLAKEEEALYTQRDNAALDLEKKLMVAQEDIKKNIDEYLEKLAKEKGYDLILIKGATGAVMYGNPRMDITNLVVQQLNVQYNQKNKK
jgi:outer membrane protein